MNKTLFCILTGCFILNCERGAAMEKKTIPFERTSVTSPMKIGARSRVTPHTMIYARIQPYDLFGNYLEEWIDRPLYHNRAFRDSASGQLAGFKRDVEAAQEYEIEGTELLARAICHETDHLEGQLYVDKVEGPLMDTDDYYADMEEE